MAIVVRCSYLEVYNEAFFDLLSDDVSKLDDLAVQDNPDGSVKVKGLSTPIVTNEEEALSLLFTGDTSRAIASHQMNSNSTRSHCIFTIHIEARSRIHSNGKTITSKLNFVDLAGSERVKKTGSSGVILEEAKYINKSLVFLQQVVMALGNKHRDHIPYRQSKLTNVLRDSLGGNCKTRLIANIWCESRNIEETISTLRFAQRMMLVQTAPTINEHLDPTKVIEQYKLEVQTLKKELAMHDTLANRGGIVYDSYTPEQQKQARDTVEQFIDGNVAVHDIELSSIRHMHELLIQFRQIVQDTRASTGAQANGHAGVQAQQEAGANGGDGALTDFKHSAGDSDTRQVGTLDDTANGFNVGHAPVHASPAVKSWRSTASPTHGSRAAGNISRASAVGTTGASSGAATDSPIANMSEAEAFEEFKTSVPSGKQLHETLLHNKACLKEKRQELKQLSGTVNGIKVQIDQLSAQVQAKRDQRPPSAGSDNAVPIIDEEEYRLISDLKKEKLAYQSTFEERKIAVSEVTYMKNLVHQAKLELGNQFLQWYTEMTNGNNGASTTATADSTNTTEQLDDAEQHELLEVQRIEAEDPDALAFYRARKKSMKHESGHALSRSARKRAGAY
jgi:kinesin family member 6/9